MVPVQLLFERPFLLLASDTLTVNDAACDVVLIKEPFTPGPTLEMGDLVEADFDGYAALVVGAIPPLESLDPVDGAALLDQLSPAGGWRWETTGVTNLPQTIYGFGFRNGDSSLMATELLPSPKTLDGANQSLIIPRVALRLPSGAIS